MVMCKCLNLYILSIHTHTRTPGILLVASQFYYSLNTAHASLYLLLIPYIAEAKKITKINNFLSDRAINYPFCNFLTIFYAIIIAKLVQKCCL